ncbi:MAG: hypothetical protein ACTTKZ_00100 [Bacteroides sp.]
MRSFVCLFCFALGSIISYAQVPRKYTLPDPEKPKQEATTKSSWGSLISTAVRATTATLGLVQHSVNLQEVSNSLYAFENNVGGSWMKDARNILGQTKEALQLYMVNEGGAYLYDPATRTLNLVAEGDFREQILEQNQKFKESRVILIAGHTLQAYATDQLEKGAEKLLGDSKKSEETTERAETNSETEAKSFPTTFNPGKVFVLLGAKTYTFD